jgi:YD repeat-containing protein
VLRFLKLLAVVFTGLAMAAAVLAADIWGPPLFSGALFLLAPLPPTGRLRDRVTRYEPVHRGHVDLATGLYIREDEDIVLGSSPAFAWRRTYLSGDHVSRHFGIGTTHNAEWYLIGDSQRFAWAELIRDDGSRIHFDRLTPGQSNGNAVFGHTETPTEYYGALLGWTGLGWRMRLRESTVLSFRACGQGANSVCSIEAIDNVDGNRVLFTRNQRGLVKEVNTGSDHLTIEYDAQHRIVKTSDTAHHSVEYSYDVGGHLEQASASGTVRRYTYDAADELVNVSEPGREIVNWFDAEGRLVHQMVRRPNHPDYSESFSYRVVDKAVIEANETEDNGANTQYRFDDHHHVVLESYDRPGAPPIMVSYDRAAGGFARSLTVRCSKDGRRVSETVEIRGDPEETEAYAIARFCDEPSFPKTTAARDR